MDLYAAQQTILSILPHDRSALVKLIHDQDIPDLCFDLALCDCAEHLLAREQALERPPEQASLEAVRAKRLWLQGQLTEQQMAQAEEAAQRALRYLEGLPWVGRQLVENAEDAFSQAVQRFLATSSERVNAARVAQRAAWFRVQQSPLSAARNAFYNLLHHGKIHESLPALLHQRLLHQVEYFIALRTQLHNLLVFRLEQLQQQALHWQNTLEETMFE